MSLWMPVAYFALSGALQTFSHTIANQCALPANQVTAWLMYLHLCFQPFFINAVALHFIDRKVASKIDLHAYTICFTAMTVMLLRGYPLSWAGHCDPDSTIMCGEHICTINDGWLQAWTIPVSPLQDHIPWYFLAAIATPLLYGSWRFILLYAACCPFMAYLITSNMGEWPGVNTLLTIPFLFAMSMDNFRSLMVIRRWLGWRTPVTEY
jgi:hypothetical protein